MINEVLGRVTQDVLLVIGILLLIYFGSKFIKNVVAGIVATFILSILAIAVMAAIPFMPEGPPETIDLPTEEIRKAQIEGRIYP